MRRMLASPHPTPLEEEDEPGSEPFAGYLSNFETTRVIRSAIPAAMTVSFALRSADTTTRAFRNYCGLIEVARSVFLGGKSTNGAVASVCTNCETAVGVLFCWQVKTPNKLIVDRSIRGIAQITQER